MDFGPLVAALETYVKEVRAAGGPESAKRRTSAAGTSTKASTRPGSRPTRPGSRPSGRIPCRTSTSRRWRTASIGCARQWPPLTVPARPAPARRSIPRARGSWTPILRGCRAGPHPDRRPPRPSLVPAPDLRAGPVHGLRREDAARRARGHRASELARSRGAGRRGGAHPRRLRGAGRARHGGAGSRAHENPRRHRLLPVARGAPLRPGRAQAPDRQAARRAAERRRREGKGKAEVGRGRSALRLRRGRPARRDHRHVDVARRLARRPGDRLRPPRRPLHAADRRRRGALPDLRHSVGHAAPVLAGRPVDRLYLRPFRRRQHLGRRPRRQEAAAGHQGIVPPSQQPGLDPRLAVHRGAQALHGHAFAGRGRDLALPPHGRRRPPDDQARRRSRRTTASRPFPPMAATSTGRRTRRPGRSSNTTRIPTRRSTSSSASTGRPGRS